MQLELLELLTASGLQELPTASELLLTAGGLGLCSRQESKTAAKEKTHKKSRASISGFLF
jgi:hypothetical protein